MHQRYLQTCVYRDREFLRRVSRDGVSDVDTPNLAARLVWLTNIEPWKSEATSRRLWIGIRRVAEDRNSESRIFLMPKHTSGDSTRAVLLYRPPRCTTLQHCCPRALDAPARHGQSFFPEAALS